MSERDDVHQSLHAAVSKIGTADSAGEVYEYTVEALADLVTADAYVVAVPGEDGLVVEFSSTGTSGATDCPFEREIAESTYRSQEPVRVDDLRTRDLGAGGCAYRSLMSIPLDDHGVIQLFSATANAFSDRAFDLAELLITYVVPTIDRVRTDPEFHAVQKSAAVVEKTFRSERYLELADVMVLGLNADGTIRFANRRACEVLGYDKADLVGNDWFETCIPAETRDDVRRVFEGLMAGDVVQQGHYENRVLTKEGAERVIEWHNTVLRNETGDIVGTVSSGLDITEHREFERELERGIHRARTLVENFPNGMVTLFDEEFRYTVVGGTIFDQLELSRDDLVGNTVSEVFPAEHVNSIEPLYREAFAGEENEVEITFEDRVFRIHVLPVRDDDGEIIAGMTMSQDITDQKERQRELATTRKRYQTHTETAPTPIIVSEAESGEIIEANDAAGELYGGSRADLLGLHRTDLHPSRDAQRYHDLYSRHREDGTTVRRFENGTQISVVTTEGETVPVEIRIEPIELAGQAVLYSIIRDISEQRHYEETLTQLHDVANELLTAESVPEIGQLIVDAATEILDLSLVSVNRFDERDGKLYPVAYSPGVDDVIGETPPLPVETSIAGRAFTRAETTVIDDVRTDTDVYNPDTDVRSQLIVPIGEFGAFISGNTTPNFFDSEDRELAELLVSTAKAAFTRVAREQKLRDRERELDRRKQQLEHLESLNSKIRDISQIAVRAETRAEIEQTVCDQLVESEPFVFAWFGVLDPAQDRVRIRARAGAEYGYLEDIPDSIDASTEPAVETITTQERTVVANTATEVQTEAWRRQALQRDYRSVMSIPLTYRDITYGALTIYASERDAFDGMVQSVLTELGELLAYAINAVERKQALLSDRMTELEFSISDSDCMFRRLAEQSDCSLVLDGLVPREADTASVFLKVTDGSVDDLLDYAEDTSSVVTARPLQETEAGHLVQLRFAEPVIATVLADYGLPVRNMRADGSTAHVAVGVPPTMTVHRAVAVVNAEYPDAEFTAKRESVSPHELMSIPERLLEELTDRQREAIQLAYHGGYFDSPKGITGADVAESMGLSSTAFNEHLRAAQRTILGVLFGEQSEDTV